MHVILFYKFTFLKNIDDMATNFGLQKTGYISSFSVRAMISFCNCSVMSLK